jgi:hypothetical protein
LVYVDPAEIRDASLRFGVPRSAKTPDWRPNRAIQYSEMLKISPAEHETGSAPAPQTLLKLKYSVFFLDYTRSSSQISGVGAHGTAREALLQIQRRCEFA